MVMDLAEPRLDYCVRQSYCQRSHSHDSHSGAAVPGSLVVVVLEAMPGLVVLGCLFCVVLEMTQKGFYHQNGVMRASS